MAKRQHNDGGRNVDGRVTAIEQILPTLATKTDLGAAIAPLATKAELLAELLATKAELRAEIREARRPFARPNGRPKSVQVPRNVAYPTCKREGCSRPSAPEQVYCSPHCAPLSKFGSEWVRNHARK